MLYNYIRENQTLDKIGSRVRSRAHNKIILRVAPVTQRRKLEIGVGKRRVVVYCASCTPFDPRLVCDEVTVDVCSGLELAK